MMRLGWLCLFGLVLQQSGFAEIPADSEDPVIAAEQDLLLLGQLEPLHIRLTVEVDGVPFRKVWSTGFQRLFDLFDTDNDESLSVEQADRFARLFQRGTMSSPNPQPNSGLMMAAKGLSREEFRRRIEQLAPPISLRQRLASQGAGPALIPLLDTDGDGRLSRDELSSAEQSLHCRDFNDDQLITQQELIAGPAVSDEDDATETGAVVLLTAAMDAAAVTDLLLARYDRNRDGTLSLEAPAELISTEGGIATLDADGDHSLSRQELRAFIDLPLDAELPLAFGSSTSGRKRGVAAPRYRLQRKLDGGYRIHVGSSEINFRRNNRDPSKDNRLPQMKDFDADNNASLDANELMNVPDRPEFDQVDIDRDGKITDTEFETFFSQRARIAAVQLVLEVSDQGADLFTTLDRNFDRVLTPRELQAAPQVLATEDRDGDGYLGGIEMSYSLVLELSRGGSRPITNTPAATMRTMTEPQVKVDRQGPAWFQKMDRNRDGDVSLLEFLGSRETFRKLDKNGDGLLSDDEAP